ncbi:MAG: SMC-Scp complex subunit ScpB [Planctomycetota bacterium]|jgi:segregation and condensation protein B
MTKTAKKNKANNPGAEGDATSTEASTTDVSATEAPVGDVAVGDVAADSSPPVAGDSGAEVTTQSVVESILLSTDVPLSANKIAQILGMGDARDVKQHIESLNAHYEESGASFRIQGIAKGFQILTLPQYNHWVRQLHKTRAESRLSPAALETLAIVAYKQPIMRADVETIRGVAVGDMLVRLRDMNLVKIVGRAEEIGRPLLYGTTRRFLEVFGLNALKDLPSVDSESDDGLPRLRPVPAEDSDVDPGSSGDE